MGNRAILLSLLLAGCPWISADQHKERLDVDGDGYPWPEDCAEGDPAVHPGATEVCNGKDDDCDGTIDVGAADPLTFYRDEDGDGYGVASDTVQACTAPDGYADKEGDCNDGAALAHPGLTEVCGDHLDNDCDGTGNDCDLQGPILISEADYVGVGSTSYDGYGNAMAFGDLDGALGPDLIVGAPSVTIADIQAGAVYLHMAPLPANPNANDVGAVVLPGVSAGDRVGASVAFLGDVDDDDHNDLLVGAPGYGTSAGAVYLLRGGTYGAGSIAQGQIGVGLASSRYGSMVAGLGDVNGDGRADLAVLAPGYPGTPPIRGAVYVFRGSPSSLDAGAATATLQHETCDPTGIAPVGDVDGDGVPDLLVGSYSCDEVQPDGGEVWLVSGNVTGTVGLEDARARFLPEGSSNLLGYTVASAGDIDGDGKADIVMGAPAYVVPGDDTYSGAVYVFTGSPEGAIEVKDATARIVGVPGSLFGISVAGVGDVNGDGFGDLLVGGPVFQVEGVIVGAAFLFYGPLVGELGLDDANAVILGPGGTLPGMPVVAAGDLNDDGYADFFVGDSGGGAAGHLYGFLGRGR